MASWMIHLRITDRLADRFVCRTARKLSAELETVLAVRNERVSGDGPV